MLWTWILIFCFLLSGCAVKEKPLLKAPISGRVILPIIFNKSIAADIAQSNINIPGDFAMTGVYLNNKLYVGGYGSGQIWSSAPANLELNNSGEAILSMIVFNGDVYATSENNDTREWPNCRTGLLKRTPTGWEKRDVQGYAAYFATVWNGQIVFTTTSSNRTNTIDVYSGDGSSFSNMGHFNDWLWVPVVYKGELYILGHGGPAYGPGPPLAVKWNGNGFSQVPALCSTPGVTEWQSAVEHKGYLYVGSGGWTLARGTSQAIIYRFDGNTATMVKSDGGYHEVQGLMSSNDGRLYASFGQGFKTDLAGGSKVWSSGDNGVSWKVVAQYPDCPQLYALMDASYGFIACGGRLGNLRCYFEKMTKQMPKPKPYPAP